MTSNRLKMLPIGGWQDGRFGEEDTWVARGDGRCCGLIFKDLFVHDKEVEVQQLSSFPTDPPPKNV